MLDIHQIKFRSTKFSSGSGFIIEIQYQSYIFYNKDTYQFKSWSANSYEFFCPHTDRRKFKNTSKTFLQQSKISEYLFRCFQKYFLL